VQLLALVQSDVDCESNRENDLDAIEGKASTSNSTLVVSPLSLLHQWKEEIENKTSLSCRVHYNDGSKTMNATSRYDSADIVMTTYGTLQAELRSKRDTEIDSTISAKKTTMLPLLSKTWKRVILDECHTIKNHTTMVAKACFLLRAERRWVVSGTIIQNSLEDLYSLLRFLRHEPFCEHAFWSSAVTNAPDFSVSLNRVKNILSPIMIRRTKETRDKSGELILSLPDIDFKSVVVQFSPEERQFYEALYRKSFDIFKGFVRAGTASSSWLKIFSLLHRLRQTCSHVALTVKSHLDDGEWTSNITQSSLGNSNMNEASMKKTIEKADSIDQSFLEDLLQKFQCMQNDRSKATSSSEKNYGNDETKDEYAVSIANMLNQAVQSDSSELNEECPICLENISMNDSAITPCLHIFCKNCLLGFLKDNSRSSGAANRGPTPCVAQERSCPVCCKDFDSRRILRMTQGSTGKIETSFLNQRVHKETKKNPNISVEDGDARKTLQTAMKGTSSSKLAAILEELKLLWEKEPGSKVLVFSQFLGFLDIIEKSFKSNGIPYGRLDGKLNLKRRMEVLRKFGSEPQQPTSSQKSTIGSVLLISMKAGGVVRIVCY
jgi:DNA repair protein RAD5